MVILLRAVAALAVLTTAAHAETRFLAAFDDVPLAPGMVELADAAFTFAGAEGRIVESAAQGEGATAEGTRAYYLSALPPLGWTVESEAGDLSFIRGRERLTLAFARGSDGAPTVRFRLVVRPASAALD